VLGLVGWACWKGSVEELMVVASSVASREAAVVSLSVFGVSSCALREVGSMALKNSKDTIRTMKPPQVISMRRVTRIYLCLTDLSSV